jgi:hypothetical protein
MRLLKLASLLALVPLAACETLGLSSSKPPEEAPATTAAATVEVPAGQPCPGSAVLSEASRVTFVRPGGTTSADLIMTAEMSPPRLECEYDSSTRVDRIDLNFPLVLTRGAASTSDEQQISYFVALVNHAGEVIAKKVYQRRIVFQGKQSFIATEKVENLVLTLGPGTRPVDHRILIGFQLTPEQLAFNRARTRLPPPAPPVPVAAPAPAAVPAPDTTSATPAPATAPAAAAPATPAPTAAPAAQPSTAVQTPPASEPPPASATTPSASPTPAAVEAPATEPPPATANTSTPPPPPPTTTAPTTAEPAATAGQPATEPPPAPPSGQ